MRYKEIYSDQINTATMEEFAKDGLRDKDYNNGALEEAQAVANNAVKAISRLVDILAGSGLLTAEQIAEILAPGGEYILLELMGGK